MPLSACSEAFLLAVEKTVLTYTADVYIHSRAALCALRHHTHGRQADGFIGTRRCQAVTPTDESGCGIDVDRYLTRVSLVGIAGKVVDGFEVALPWLVGRDHRCALEWTGPVIGRNLQVLTGRARAPAREAEQILVVSAETEFRAAPPLDAREGGEHEPDPLVSGHDRGVLLLAALDLVAFEVVLAPTLGGQREGDTRIVMADEDAVGERALVGARRCRPGCG